MSTARQLRQNLNDKTEIEIFQERAEVLGRAGEALSRALEQLRTIGDRIHGAIAAGIRSEKQRRTVNDDIVQFNEIREHARLRYYYLIVTREAVGFRGHRAVDETYPIPPRIKPLTRKEWTGSRDRD